jgi:hypothetical protein
MKVTLYTPHANQQRIHDSINNEPFKYYSLNIGRQFGKSLLCLNQALYWFYNDPKCQIAWASPTYKQAKKVFKDIEDAFGDNPRAFKDKNKTDLYLKSPNGATMQFFSNENYDNNRGPTFDYGVIDEAAWQYEGAWTEVMRAWFLVKGKKVLLASTPKGKNWFYKVHALDGVNNQYKSFTMTSYDNPLITPSEIDDARLTLPDNVFRQEYLAEFIDGGAGVFKELTINDQPVQTDKYYFGIDWGKAEDYTVLTILNREGQMVCCERWRQKPWLDIIVQMVKHLKHWNAQGYSEANSIGDPLFEQLTALYPKAELFYTTSKSKQDIIEGLQVAVQNKEFTSLSHEWLKKEFELFTYVYSQKTRTVKYSAPVGFHDDGVMSCAMAYHALKSLKNTGRFSIM